MSVPAAQTLDDEEHPEDCQGKRTDDHDAKACHGSREIRTSPMVHPTDRHQDSRECDARADTSEAPPGQSGGMFEMGQHGADSDHEYQRACDSGEQSQCEPRGNIGGCGHQGNRDHDGNQ